ncbi:MAG: hypothetical protein V1859_07260 [archaeon]
MEPHSRLTAYKVQICDIVNGDYVKKSGWERSYLNSDNKTISRVNLIGILVSKEESFLSIDDGTGSLQVRVFELPFGLVDKIEIGNLLLIIGMIREWNNEIYLVPEIIKKIENKRWLDVRKLELSQKDTNITSISNKIQEKITVAEKEASKENLYDKAISLIKLHDKGNGADYDKIILEMKSQKADQIIKMLIEEGDVFENLPGRIKCLE